MSSSAAKRLVGLIAQAVEEIEADNASRIPGGTTSDVNQPIVAPEDKLEFTLKRREAMRTLESATHQLLSTLMPAGLRILNLHYAFFKTAAIDVAVQGRIADLIHSIDPESKKGGVHVEVLAEKAGINPRKLEHILRFLALHNVFCELSPNHWGNTRISLPLRTDSPNTLWNSFAFTRDEIALPALVELPNVLFDKERGSQGYQTPLQKYYNHDGDLYDFLSKAEGGQRAKRFGLAMTEWNNIESTRLQLFEWQKKLGSSGIFVDVGGGIGSTAHEISTYLPGWSIVVQDRPEVVKNAKENYQKMKSAAKVEFEEVDFFQEQPPHRVGGADVYFVKSILHNWPFHDCVQLLTQLRKAAKPTTRLLICDVGIEPPILDSNSPILPNGGMACALAHTIDLIMLTAFDGEERSKEELSKIFSASGWILQEATPLGIVGFYMFEGVPNPAWK